MFDFQVSKEEFVEEFCREDEKKFLSYISLFSLMQQTLLLYTLHVTDSIILGIKIISSIH
jgi:hypothetical protein